MKNGDEEPSWMIHLRVGQAFNRNLRPRLRKILLQHKFPVGAENSAVLTSSRTTTVEADMAPTSAVLSAVKL